jgi:hypothetical protein
MKSYILISIALLLTLLNKSTNASMDVTSFVGRFKDSVSKLELSIAQQQSAAEVDSDKLNIKPLWDLLSPLHRFVLLNQTGLQSLWNVRNNLEKSLTKLEWNSLPDNAQTFLKTQAKNLGFLDLTFLELSWVNSDKEKFHDATLKSLLSKELIDRLAELYDSINRLTYDQLVNLDLLSQHVNLDELYVNFGLNYLPMPPRPYNTITSVIFNSDSETANVVMDRALFKALEYLKKNMKNCKLVY